MARPRFRPSWRSTAIGSALLSCAPAQAQILVDDLARCGANPLADATRSVTLRGKQEITVEWRNAPPAPLVILVREQGIDVNVQLASRPEVADSPVRRAGSQLLIVEANPTPTLALRILGKDPPQVSGQVNVSLHSLPTDEACRDFLRQVASGDRQYAAAEANSSERAARAGDAAAAYAGAEAIATRMHSAAFAGHAQLAIATTNYQGRSDWKGSSAAGLRGARSFQEAQRSYYRARATSVAAAAMLESGISPTGGDVHQEARAYLSDAVKVFQAGGYTYDQALQTNNIALSHLYAAEFDSCVSTSERAIKLFEKLGDRHRVALAQQNIAMCQWGLGRIRAASAILERAIPVLKDAPLAINYTTALNNGALAHFALGEFDRSILLHAQGEQVARQFSMPRELAQSQYGLGVTYAAIGDLDTALDYLEHSLRIRTVELDRRGRMVSLRALASLLDARGDSTRANQMDREALAIGNNDLTRLRIELRLMQRSIVAGDVTPAIRQRLDDILKGVPGGDRISKARARHLRGLVASGEGNAAVAYTEFEAAQKEFSELEYIDGEYDACVADARLAHRLQDFARARSRVECAGRLADQMRAQVLSPELRANVGQLRRDAADLEVLISADDPREPATRAERVLAVMERHRGRLLDDYSSVSLQPGADGVDLRRLYDDLATARAVFADAMSRGNADSVRAGTMRRRIAELRMAVLAAENRVRSKGRTLAPDYSVTSADLKKLPGGTALVEYWMGNQRAFAAVMTREGVRLEELAAPGIVDTRVRELRAALSDASSTGIALRREKMQEISRLVLAPLRLDTDMRRIVFVSDGSINYVPLPALCLSGTGCSRSLVEQYEIASTPSVNRFLKSPPKTRLPGQRVLVVADPVYQDGDARLALGRLAQAESDDKQADARIAALRSGGPSKSALRRLPGTAIEANRIAELYPAKDVDLLLGLEASRDKVLALDLERYGVIHFAVHGLSDEEMPQLSALALSRFRRDGRAEDGRLWAGDLLQRRFNARLVFLSACDTAIGPQFSGEGLIGLSFVLLSRGANNVISSLWPVEDVMTSELVADVYARMRNGESVVAALTGAQRAYLNKNKDRDIRKWAAWSASVGAMEVPGQ